MEHGSFNPNDVTMSKMRPYSMGIVSQNKPLNTNFIDVMPVEDLNMANGEITGDTKDIKVSGKTATGASFNSNVKSKVTIRAEWMPVGGGNRITSPDVRRGAVVQLYQFGDSSDHYFWTTLKDDMHLRKLETAVYAFSATTKESSKTDGANSYFLEVSTHKKLVTLHTSKANGEPFSYDIQVNAGDGKVVITDDIGNLFVLDSRASRLFMKNSSSSSVEILKDNVTLIAGKAITSKSSTHEIIAPGGIMLNGPVSGVGGGGAKFDGKMEVQSLKSGDTTLGNVTASSYSEG